MFRGWLAGFCLAVIAFSFTSLATAQTSTAKISGVITDESGGVLPGGQVTVRNSETGVQRTFTADEKGRYIAPDLVPGPYEVTATATGFETLVRRGITLTVGQDANINLTMKVGAVTEQVSVTAEAPLVDTSSSSVSGVVEEKRITDLPLNGRDFSQLALVQPGVLSIRNSDVGASKGFGTRIAIAGSRVDQTGWLLDGTNMKSVANFGTPGSATGVMMGVDAVREFRVLTGGYSAEFGGSSGGVVQLVTKSGTNQIHGSAYEFLRNSAVDARKFTDQAKPEFRRNQFGGSLGGPIKKDKAFYFGNFEGLRQALIGSSVIASVPSAAVHNGIVGGVQFPIAPEIKPFLDLYPLPNGPVKGDTGQLFSPSNEVLNEDYFVTRVDYYLSPNQTLFARFTFDQGNDSLPDVIPLENQTILTHSRFATVQYERIISPRLLSTARIAYNRTNVSSGIALNTPYPKSAFFLDYPYPVQITVTGVDQLGPSANNVSTRVQNLYEVSEGLIYSRGAHSMKFGFNYQKPDFNTSGPAAGAYGAFGWSTLSDFLQDNKLLTSGAQFPISGTFRSLRQNVYAPYIQDDWQVRHNFTLNLGLRYEPFTAPTEKWNRLSSVRDWLHATKFDVGVPFWNQMSLKNFSPRVGFAWDPKGDGKTAVRAGFGLFYEDLLGAYYRTFSTKNPPFVASLVNSFTTFTTAPAEVAVVGPTALSPITNSTTFYETVDGNIKPSYEIKFNFSVEHEIAKDLSVTVGYVGARGIHLWRILDANAVMPIQVNGRSFVVTGAPRPNPNIGNGTLRDSDAQSFYNSLNVEVKKRVSRGFQFQASYTWSKNVDDTTTGVAQTDYNEGASSQPYNKTADRGLSSLDLAQNLVINGIWTVPSPAGAGFANYLFGGWQLSSIFSASSGVPFTVYVSGRNAQDATRNAGRQHPDLVDGRTSSSIVSGTSAGCGTGANAIAPGTKVGTPSLYFDPCAYFLPPAGFYGNAGRNTLIGPGFAEVDFSLMKNIPLRLREGMRMEFHADVFNLLNRPNLAPPQPTLSAAWNAANRQLVPGTGALTKIVGSARQMQFGLKIIF